MFHLLLLAFVFVALIVVFAIAVIGAVIFHKRSIQPCPLKDPENVIDVTVKVEE